MPPTFASSTEFIQHGLNTPACPICREDYNNTNGEMGDTYQIVSIETCGHQYHKECLTAWVTNHNTCPTCRTTLYNRPQEALDAELALEDLGEYLMTLSRMLCRFRRDHVPLPPGLNPTQLDCIHEVETALISLMEERSRVGLPQGSDAQNISANDARQGSLVDYGRIIEAIDEEESRTTALDYSDLDDMDLEEAVRLDTQLVRTLSERHPEIIQRETLVVRSIITEFDLHEPLISNAMMQWQEP